MADDITLNSGSGGATLAADDIAGVKYQRVKISVGADGAAADNSTAAPLAVKISDGTDVATVTAGGLLQVDASGATVPVSGTVTAELSAVDNAVLDNIDADLTTVIGHVDGIEGLLTTMDADTGGILTAVQLIDDAVHAEDVAAAAGDKGIAILAVRRDADTTLVGATNDYANLQVDANGYLKVEIFDGGGSHTVDNAGTFAVQVSSALPAGTNAIGKLAANSGVDIGDVDVLTLPNVTLAAGTNTNEVVGDVAHDSPVGGNPLLQGLEGRSTAPTAVGSGDVVRALATLLGKQVVYPYAIPAETWQYAGPTGGITDTADDAIQAAGGAGVRHYVTSLTVVNSHATVSTEVVVKDGSTVIHRGYAAAAGGGYALTFPTPLRGTAATALNVACITTGSATVVSASGFSAAE